MSLEEIKRAWKKPVSVQIKVDDEGKAGPQKEAP